MTYRPLSFSEPYPPEQLQDIGGFAAPPAQSIAPFHATKAVFKLLANKEDTRQVFDIVGAMSGGSYKRFVETDYGRRVVTEPIKLEEILGRREWLRDLPDGSLGRTYLDFMEGEDLTPDGILDAANEAGLDYQGETQFEELRRMSMHLDVVHDLWHVLTGYSRDTLGEICLLVFTYQQAGNFGFRMITGIGALASKLEQPRAPILKAMKEARITGQATKWFPEQDIEALLPLPLEEVRRQLNISKSTVYEGISHEIKENLLKPRVTETQAQREQAA